MAEEEIKSPDLPFRQALSNEPFKVLMDPFLLSLRGAQTSFRQLVRAPAKDTSKQHPAPGNHAYQSYFGLLSKTRPEGGKNAQTCGFWGLFDMTKISWTCWWTLLVAWSSVPIP